MSGRFSLDETAAAAWLAQRNDIDPGWSPVHDDEGGTIGELVSEAQSDNGPITCPPGYEIGYEYSPDSDGGGYRWFVWVPGMPTAAIVTAFTSAPRYAGGIPLTANGRSTTITGPGAALAVLREAVAEPNRVLDELDTYIAHAGRQQPKTTAPQEHAPDTAAPEL